MARLLPTRAGALVGFYVLELNLAFWTYHGTKKKIPLENHYLTHSEAQRREKQLQVVLRSLQAFTESIQLLPPDQPSRWATLPLTVFSWQTQTLTHFLQLVEPFYGSSIYSGGPPNYDLLVPVLFDNQFFDHLGCEFRLLLGLGLIEKCARWMMALLERPDGQEKITQIQHAISRFYLASEMPDEIIQILVDQGDIEMTAAKQSERTHLRRPKYIQPEPQDYYRKIFNTLQYYSPPADEARVFLLNRLKTGGPVSVMNFYRYLMTPQLQLTYPLARQILDQVDFNTLAELSAGTLRELPVQWAKALSLVLPLETGMAGVLLEFLRLCFLGFKLPLHRMMAQLIREKPFGRIMCHGEFSFRTFPRPKRARVYHSDVILALYRLLFNHPVEAMADLTNPSFYRLLSELARRPDYRHIEVEMKSLLHRALDQGLIRPSRWFKQHLGL